LQIFVYILAPEMASAWNQHCASGIGTLSIAIQAQQFNRSLPQRS